MDIVSVTNLKKTYGDFAAVNGVDFSIGRGEIFGFLGPNGAGKTSTINMMIGLSKPTEGTIIIKGIDVRKQVKKAQSIMGIVPDESNLYDELDGFENLCFCASLYGMRKEERESKAKQLLDKFRLTEAGKRPFKAYSKGMRRKLVIAAGIIHSPQILFLDEPTTGIDIESARQIRELIVELKNQGTTVFITTHYIEDAERICDRIAFIVSGKIIAIGSVPELMESISHGYMIRLSAEESIMKYAVDLQARFEGCNINASQNNSLVLASQNRIPLLPVIQYFDEKGVSIYEVKQLRPTLEDVFVKVTGIEAEKLEKEKGVAGK
ncbi:ABC transporter ATP-binding protein [Lutispora saccharofermentans]|uniref:ABC transporter ATP-binding protein n=1 Tax=Lutispora saccharofermentans TaxID=3024236 RepID=A0ABT1NH85_9FIRM|nr:ABC transporter ATP-binding protein [Lutispora saccharofermentans]MCQ1529671.1 ABC transporter ATP-binding protein [Lutispora saccharofermentans]